MATTQLIATKNTYLSKSSPTINFFPGVDNLALRAYDTNNYVFRPLVTFDGTTIAGKTIESATLSLYIPVNPATGIVGTSIDVLKMSHNDWVETQATWNIYKTASNWTLAGGDYVTTPVNGTNTIPGTLGWITFDITAIVQDAADNSININLLVKGQEENWSDYVVLPFISRSYAIDTSLRPKLDITYGTPETKTVSDTIASVTESVTTSDVAHTITVANNNQAYVLNNVSSVLGGQSEPIWTHISNYPFSVMLYSPSMKKMYGARRDVGNVAWLDSYPIFDTGNFISWEFDTGYFDFGEFDEVKAMPEIEAQALKVYREFQAQGWCVSDIIITCSTDQYSNNDIIITIPSTVGPPFVSIKVPMSRDIRGVSIRMVFSGTSGFWLGKMALRAKARGHR